MLEHLFICLFSILIADYIEYYRLYIAFSFNPFFQLLVTYSYFSTFYTHLQLFFPHIHLCCIAWQKSS